MPTRRDMRRAPRIKSQKGRSGVASKPVTFETVRQLAQALPGTEEGTSYGTPAFRVKGKLFIRLREDGDSLVVRVDHHERELLMAANPKAFFITDHYRDYPMMLVRLSTVRLAELRALLEDSWRRVAPKRLITAHDAQS